MPKKPDPEFHAAIQRISRDLFGNITLEGVTLDPEKQELEISLVKGLLELSASPVATPSTAAPPPPVSSSVDATEIQLSDLVKKYCAEHVRTESWTAKTEDEVRRIFQNLIECEGDLLVSQFTYENSRSYKETLQTLPRNRSKNPRYAGKSITQIIAMSPTDRLSTNSINKHLNRCSSLFRWAVTHGYTKSNYFEGLGLKKKLLPSEERLPFDSEDLDNLFSSEIYTALKYKHPYHYWLPLLAVYTGARIEELCQLTVSDIYYTDEIPVITINDNDGKRLKTPSAKRLIPIHPRLVQLGLFDYRKQKEDRKETRLFPELKKLRDGYSQAAGKWFNDRYKVKRNVINKRKSFHSFRHSFSDQMKEHGVEFRIQQYLLGHSDDSVTTGRYGSAPSVRSLAAAINKVAYPSLDEVKPWANPTPI